MSHENGIRRRDQAAAGMSAQPAQEKRTSGPDLQNIEKRNESSVPRMNCSDCHFGKAEKGAFGVELVRCNVHRNTYQATWHCRDWEQRS